jgi:hypothetical protein
MSKFSVPFVIRDTASGEVLSDCLWSVTDVHSAMTAVMAPGGHTVMASPMTPADLPWLLARAGKRHAPKSYATPPEALAAFNHNREPDAYDPSDRQPVREYVPPVTAHGADGMDTVVDGYFREPTTPAAIEAARPFPVRWVAPAPEGPGYGREVGTHLVPVRTDFDAGAQGI